MAEYECMHMKKIGNSNIMYQIYAKGIYASYKLAV